MGWRGRAPWILAAVLALAAIAGWQDAMETHRRFAGVPEELKALAAKVDKLEGEMDTVRQLAKAIVDQLPTDKEGVPPPSEFLEAAIKGGVTLKEGSCLWRLAEAVKDCMVKGRTTPADRERILKIMEECDAGM